MSQSPNITQEGVTQGSIVVNDYVKRSVRVLAIHDHEVDQISFLNGLSSLFFSAASGLVSFALGIWVNAAFQDNLSATALVLAKVVGPIAIIFAFIAAIVGALALKKRGSLLGTIKAQSVPQPSPN